MQTMTRPTETEARPNRYAGDCHRCGQRVAAEEGYLDGRGENGSYLVAHHDCPEAEAPEKKGRSIEDYPEPVLPGTYTVVLDDGHVTLRVNMQPDDADFAPGAVLVSYLAGRDNEGDYNGFAFIRDGKGIPWKRYRGEGSERLRDALDRLVAGESTLESRPCLRCNRTLTRPDSIALGIGPECASLGW